MDHEHPRRVLILDPGAIGPVSHHFLHDTIYERELTARGFETTVLVHRDCPTSPATGFTPRPYFTAWPYGRPSRDPISGWLENHIALSETIHQDLRRLPPDLLTGPEAVRVIMHTLHHSTFAGVCRWIAELPREGGPVVHLLFGLQSGFVVGDDETPPEPAIAPLYRMGFNILKEAAYPRLVMAAPLPAHAAEFRALADGLPVTQHPLHFAGDLFADLAPAPRRDGRIRLLYAGDARPNKGFLLLPEIIEALLTARPDIEAAVQVSGFVAAGGCEPAARRLSDLAARTGRVELLFGHTHARDYLQMLADCDALLLPYDAEDYRTLVSGVHTEALFLGKPSVVPAGSVMAELNQALGGCGVAFPACDAPTVAAATLALVDELPLHQARARRARTLWRSRHGNRHLMDFLLSPIAGGVPA